MTSAEATTASTASTEITGLTGSASGDFPGPTSTTDASAGSATTDSVETGTPDTSGTTGPPAEPDSCDLADPVQRDAFGASTTDPSTTGTSADDTSDIPESCDPFEGVEERTSCFPPIGDPKDGLCNEFADDTPSFDLLSCGDEFLYDETLLDFCGPYVSSGKCCFDLLVHRIECCGRPFVVGAEPRLADTLHRTDWLTVLQPRLRGIDAATRRLLVRAWSEDAAAEHASVAAFARFILQLLAVGAPSELVADAQAALADEIEHARMCYALASAYAGRPLGPDRLAIDGALAGITDLTSAALSTLYEGCIGETLAAIEATAAAGLARDPAIVGALTRIADDERRHAALAWRFLAWTLERGGPRLHHALASAVAGVGIPPPREHEPAAALDIHGHLSPATKYAEHRAGLREVILPIAHALLRQKASVAA